MNRILLFVVVLMSLSQTIYSQNEPDVQAVANDSGAVVKVGKKAVVKADKNGAVIKVGGKTVAKTGKHGAVINISDSMIDAIDSAFSDTGFCDEVIAPDVDDLLDDLDDMENGFHFGNIFTKSMAIGATAIILLFFVLPLIVVIGVIILVWLYFRNRRKKQQQENELIRTLAENGQDVSQFLNRQRPAETRKVVEYRTVDKNGKTISSRVKVEKTATERYNKGITNTIVGAAITFVCWVFNWADIFVMGGMILLAVGISQMITAKNAMDAEANRDSYDRSETPKEEPKDKSENESTPNSTPNS